MDADMETVRGRGIKQGNKYSDVLGDIYDRTPKAVLAAIAVSLALRDAEDRFDKVEAVILEEWRILHQNGFVPQKPLRAAIQKAVDKS